MRLDSAIAEALHVSDDGTLAGNARYGVDLQHDALLEKSTVVMNHADATAAIRIGDSTRVRDVYASAGTGVTSRGINAAVTRSRVFSS